MLKTVTALAAAATLIFVTAPAQAVPLAHRCPPNESGFQLWDVDTEPYRADNLADDFGNSDGWVCAKPIKLVTDDEGNPFQLYAFIDNRIPA